MAEEIVSKVLEKLASIIYQQVEETTRLVVRVVEEMKRLTSHFEAIQVVLIDAENRQVKENGVRVWLDKLKDVSYDVEDVLDEWNTITKKLQLKKVEDVSKPLIKVCSLISYYLCCCRRSVLRYDMAVKIKNLDRRLDIIESEKNSFQFKSITKGEEELERPVTASVIDITKVHGRDEDKNIIVNLLLSQSSQNQLVISIVGMGGIGKTTLARLVFNNDDVKTHFNKKIWVCVSEPFNKMRIAKAILESLTNVSPNLNELETVLQNIGKHIEGKKFLLVLDDVWTENPSDWEQLMETLKCGSQESKILVTTRKENAANVIGTTKIISVGALPNNDCWSLFSQIAFSGRSNEECEILKKIGIQIVEKCKGLPLAVKILASLLRIKRKIEEWRNVLDSEMWELKVIEERLFPPLLLSYYDLPYVLKKCFSYCAIFPKDYMIEKEQLIMLWMAQDYLKEEQNKDMMLVGEEYFEILMMRSFFQDFEKDVHNNICSFKMHDIVHDLAQYLMQNECYKVLVDDSEKSESEYSYKNLRHSMINDKVESPFHTSICTQKGLRTLVVKREMIVTEIVLSKLFDELIYLRTLDLSKQSIEEIPKGIKRLIHLRYLNLSINYMLKELPETLCELYNLQTLDVSECGSLQALPLGIGKLINLKHLRIWMTSISYMPKSFERMTGLQTLYTFVISNGRIGSKACPLECLKNFNHLRKIGIRGLGNVVDVHEVKGAELNKKENLRGLYLEFDGSKNMNHEGVFQALQLPPKLEELSIKNYRSNTVLFPQWIMSLTTLRLLHLERCINCEYLPPLGKLVSLEVLYIESLESVTMVGNEFLGMGVDATSSSSSSSSVTIFPKLKYLLFFDMKQWEDWEEEEGGNITIMPCLQTLKIYNCPKLKSLPNHLRQMTTLEKKIIGCPLLGRTSENQRDEL